MNDREYVDMPTFYECNACGQVYSRKQVESLPLGSFLFRKKDSVMVKCPKDMKEVMQVDELRDKVLTAIEETVAGYEKQYKSDPTFLDRLAKLKNSVTGAIAAEQNLEGNAVGAVEDVIIEYETHFEGDPTFLQRLDMLNTSLSTSVKLAVLLHTRGETL